MTGRQKAKAARRKDAKRQRAEKHAEKSRKRSLSLDRSTPMAARHRLAMLREALVRGDGPSPRGLLNLGNTCYFNAVMQNLARVAAFRDYFIGTAPCPGEGPMTSAFRAFLIAMWDLESHSPMDPTKLLNQVSQANSSFSGRAQHDAHELMRVVFDAVVEEEKKRLTKVAEGVLPESEADQSDNCSENSQSSTGQPEDVPDAVGSSEHETECGSVETKDIDLSEVEDCASVTIQLPPPPEGLTEHMISDQLPSNSEKIEEPKRVSSSLEEGSEKAASPPKKPVTLVESTFGGVLSSTIHCQECGFRSSVTEPFFDLQLPLVPRDESDVKRDEEAKSARKGKVPKKSIAESTKSAPGPSSSLPAADSLNKPAELLTVVQGPAFQAPTAPPPPLPPPLPPPPRRSPIVTSSTGPSSGSANCDIMAELRNMSELRDKAEGNDAKALTAESVVDASAITERRMVVYGSVPTPPEPPGGDTASIFGDDDEEEDTCLASLFDTDGANSGEDAALDDVNGMTAFSTSEAAQSCSPPPKSNPQPKKAQSASSRRGGPSFISSFLGGFGGGTPAPHGYRSVISSLEEFTKSEVLEGDNAYGCEECTRKEKLRIALSRKRRTVITKKSKCSSDEAHATDGALSENAVKGDHVEKSSSNESKTTTSEERVLMSSPVTSSESSSGVSSEDDGELVIEEEPENKVGIRILTKEEEDSLIKRLDVDVPMVRTRAVKRMVIKEAPSVLALQLKRFTQFGYRGGLRKMTGHVEFPSTLDMMPFMDDDNSCGEREIESQWKDGSQNDSNPAKASKGQTKYVLTGIAVHCGSLSGGHYVSYVREGVDSGHRGGWFSCNDSRISRTNEKVVMGSEAYLLFYERVVGEAGEDAA